MLIDLSEVFPVEGKEKSWEVPLETGTFTRADGTYPVRALGPVRVTVKNIGDRKLALSGGATVVVTMPCARCLGPVEEELELEFDQEIDTKDSDMDRARRLDEQIYISGHELDVDRLVCGELTLNLPVKVLCKEDCKGICSQCGANLNEGPCGCEEKPKDPRMAAIQDIFKQFQKGE